MSEWLVASGKKSAKKSSQGFKIPTKVQAHSEESLKIDGDNAVEVPKIIMRLSGIKKSLRDSILYEELLEKLKYRRNRHHRNKSEGGKLLVTSRVVAFGIGKFTSSEVSLLQFALLLCLIEDEVQSELKVPSVIFDPICGEKERMVCSAFNIETLHENIHGKFDAMNFASGVNDEDSYEKLTLFYMPHCPYSLYNNVLWRNWSKLSAISILGNSFDSYSLRHDSTSKSDCDCLRVLLPYVTELEVWCASRGDRKKCEHAMNLKYMETAFNDMNLMYFQNDIEGLGVPVRPREESIDAWNEANDSEVH